MQPSDVACNMYSQTAVNRSQSHQHKEKQDLSVCLAVGLTLRFQFCKQKGSSDPSESLMEVTIELLD